MLSSHGPPRNDRQLCYIPRMGLCLAQMDLWGRACPSSGEVVLTRDSKIIVGHGTTFVGYDTRGRSCQRGKTDAVGERDEKEFSEHVMRVQGGVLRPCDAVAHFDAREQTWQLSR